MVRAGDVIQIDSSKTGQPSRRGVVTGTSGRMVKIRWDRGDESLLMPQAGSLKVVGHKAPAKGKSPKKV